MLLIHFLTEQILLLLVMMRFSGLSSAVAENRVVSVGVYDNPPKILTDETGEPASGF